MLKAASLNMETVESFLRISNRPSGPHAECNLCSRPKALHASGYRLHRCTPASQPTWKRFRACSYALIRPVRTCESGPYPDPCLCSDVSYIGSAVTLLERHFEPLNPLPRLLLTNGSKAEPLLKSKEIQVQAVRPRRGSSYEPLHIGPQPPCMRIRLDLSICLS